MSEKRRPRGGWLTLYTSVKLVHISKNVRISATKEKYEKKYKEEYVSTYVSVSLGVYR